MSKIKKKHKNDINNITDIKNINNIAVSDINNNILLNISLINKKK